MLISYTGLDEVIVCTDFTEKETIKLYFEEGGRDLEDYNRKEMLGECAVSIGVNLYTDF